MTWRQKGPWYLLTSQPSQSGCSNLSETHPKQEVVVDLQLLPTQAHPCHFLRSCSQPSGCICWGQDDLSPLDWGGGCFGFIYFMYICMYT